MAMDRPDKVATFKTKHLNVWVSARAPFFDVFRWQSLANSAMTAESLRGWRCFVALDLASKLDLAVYGRLFRSPDGAHYHWVSRFFLPAERLEDSSRRHYAVWVASGGLVTTSGNMIDVEFIADQVLADAERHPVAEVVIDPWGSSSITPRFASAGLTVVEVAQVTRHLSDPMKTLEAMIVAGKITHDGNAAMTWCLGNVTAKRDANDNVFPRKEAPELKIDGAVALIMALSRAAATPAEDLGAKLMRAVRARGIVRL